MGNVRRFDILFFIIAMAGIYAVHNLWVKSQTVANVPYSEFLTWLKEGKVKEVSVGTELINGELKQAEDGKARFVTTRVDEDLADTLAETNVKFSGRVES